MKTRQKIVQSQGVKSDFIECHKHQMINKNQIDKCFNIDTNQCVNSQTSTLHVNTNVECANRFAILARMEEVDESLQGKTNFLNCTDVDPDAFQGESPVKNTPVVTDPQVSNHPVNKYNLELRFKPKHRNAVNLAKTTLLSSVGMTKQLQNMVLFPWGTSFVLIKILGTHAQLISLIFTSVLNLQGQFQFHGCIDLSCFQVKGGQVGLIPRGLLGQPIEISH